MMAVTSFMAVSFFDLEVGLKRFHPAGAGRVAGGIFR
jgi:hypothetical protein